MIKCKWVVIKCNNKYCFRFLSPNDTVLLESIHYKDLNECLKELNFIKKNSNKYTIIHEYIKNKT
jgi:uncharacterized protein YegP (UPF0339 family)